MYVEQTANVDRFLARGERTTSPMAYALDPSTGGRRGTPMAYLEEPASKASVEPPRRSRAT